jgi:hypothetical protein
MSLKQTPQYQQLKEAMELINDLKIPEHLQQKAFEHLLEGSPSPTPESPEVRDTPGKLDGTTKGLRDFITEHNPRGAVAEIPALLYWRKTCEKQEAANESDILTLYRRANLRPPKNIPQSVRDLSSKKYGRLEVAKDKPGYVRLSQTGEDFVLYDLKQSQC